MNPSNSMKLYTSMCVCGSIIARACVCLCGGLLSTLFVSLIKGSGRARVRRDACWLSCEEAAAAEGEKKKTGLRRHMRTRRKEWARASAGRGELDRLCKVGERD